MKNERKTRMKALLMATVMTGLMAPVAAQANTVVLKSSDGSINLTGDMIEHTKEFYVLRTTLGDLRVSTERVRCEGADCPVFEVKQADVTIAGSDTVGLGLMPLLMQGFASHLDAEASIVPTNQSDEVIANFVGDGGFGDDMASYKVKSTGSGDAFTALRDRNSQLGMSSRRIKPQEARELKAAGAGNMVSPNQEHIIAVDGLVMITHPSNPVNELSMEQMRAIYSGQINNWSQLGGEDREITFVTRQDSSGSRSVFEDRMIGDKSITLAANHMIAQDNIEMSSLVTDNPGALGYVGFAFQRGAKPLTLVNECGIATEPDAFSAKTEEYALQRRMYLYNRADASDENLANFIEFATSEQADGVVRKSGFIDLGIRARGQGLDSARAVTLVNADLDSYESGYAMKMLSEMVEYDRLSTTFRFRTGSSRLDERGMLDMERLVRFLKSQPNGAEVALVGFTDDVGAFDANQALAADRAGVVAQQLRALAPEIADKVTFTAKGYGEIAPVACNISDNGRAINRRVEVWIKPSA